MLGESQPTVPGPEVEDRGTEMDVAVFTCSLCFPHTVRMQTRKVRVATITWERGVVVVAIAVVLELLCSFC